MSSIHIACLENWLNSKRSYKENEHVKTYCWKALECELCKLKFPDVIQGKNGKNIDIMSYDKPENDYIILESVTSQNIKIIHSIDMDGQDEVKIGRGHDC